MSESPDDHALPEGLAAPGRMNGHCVGHRIEIDAPPELVWDFVADFEGWPDWNPLYVETSGRAEPGERIRFVVQLEGLKPQKAQARMVTIRSPELLEYRTANLGGLVKAFRFVEVEELTPTRCAVINGEILGGPLGSFVHRTVGTKVGKGLEAMNRALRRIAELKWNGARQH